MKRVNIVIPTIAIGIVLALCSLYIFKLLYSPSSNVSTTTHKEQSLEKNYIVTADPMLGQLMPEKLND